MYICLLFLARNQSSNYFLQNKAKSHWLSIFDFNYETDEDFTKFPE